MKKSKGQTIDLLYIKEQDRKKTEKVKKNKKQNNTIKTIDLDNEIVIGLTPKKEETKKKKNSNRKNVNKKNTQKSNKKIKNRKDKKRSSVKKNDNRIKSNKNNKKNIKKIKIIKWITILTLCFVAIIMFMMSSVFNIKQIIVSNNSKVTSEEIISLSKLTIDTNMFRVNNKNINNNIKINPYIESVKVKRSLNGIITLEIKERIPTYMLQFGNSYVYINNQGYMLEFTEEPINLPIIKGFTTANEEIKQGNRLILEDLKKLEEVIKIIESAKNISLSNVITSIDISDKQNYVLNMDSEGKIVQFGDATNINVKLLRIKEIIKKEKGISGEIYFQDQEKTVFKETVSF